MDITKRIQAMARALKAGFTLHDKPIIYEEVFSDTGLLPAIAKRADQLCSLCLGYGIGVSFQDADKTTLGVKVQFDDVTPDVLRLLCICDVLSEIIKASASRDRVSLDELMYD
jgi:intracellular multiplication protein IcmS